MGLRFDRGGDLVNEICDHWSDCGVKGGGCCAKNLYGGRPSLGICTRSCSSRVVGLTIRKSEIPDQLEQEAENQAPMEAPSLLSKAISYAKAEISRFTQTITEAEIAARIDMCRSCSKLVKSTEDGKIGWCDSCGCGKAARAELTIKATMPAATCPLNKWPDIGKSI